MTRISESAYITAIDSTLSVVKVAQYGNSLFGDTTYFVQVEDLYFVRESRVYYKLFIDEVEHNFFVFDNAAEAKKYFAEAEAFSDNYANNHVTCAGGF